MTKLNRILLEVTGRCNKDCSYCPREWLPSHRNLDMEMKTINYLIDNFPKSVKWCHPQGYGEPLLHPQIVDIVQALTDKKIKTKFFTNSSLLDHELTQGLGKAGLNQIVFSLHDYDSQSQEHFNILMACKYFERYKTKTIVKITRDKESDEQIKSMKYYWNQVADAVAVSPAIEICTPDLMNMEKWKWTQKREKTHVCDQINSQLMIRSDGTISLCCQDWFGMYPIGHIKDLELGITLEDMFKNKSMEFVRKHLKKGTDIPLICEMCPACR